MHHFAIRVRYGDTGPEGMAYYETTCGCSRSAARDDPLAGLRAIARSEESGIPAAGGRGAMPLPPARALRRSDRVETGVLSVGRASVRFGYRIVNEASGELLAHGITEHCFLGAGGRRCGAPETLAALLERAPRAPDAGAFGRAGADEPQALAAAAVAGRPLA